MGFSEDLDRYLTTDHESDKWISFYEAVAESHTNEFYDANEEWIEDNELTYNDLIQTMYERDVDPKYVAKVIERLHSLYKL